MLQLDCSLESAVIQLHYRVSVAMLCKGVMHFAQKKSVCGSFKENHYHAQKAAEVTAYREQLDL